MYSIEPFCFTTHQPGAFWGFTSKQRREEEGEKKMRKKKSCKHVCACKYDIFAWQRCRP